MAKVARASEVSRHFGKYHDAAMGRTVIVTRHNRETIALVPIEEYRRMRANDRRALGIDELSEPEIRALAAAEMNPRHAHLDREMEE